MFGKIYMFFSQGEAILCSPWSKWDFLVIFRNWFFCDIFSIIICNRPSVRLGSGRSPGSITLLWFHPWSKCWNNFKLTRINDEIVCHISIFVLILLKSELLVLLLHLNQGKCDSVVSEAAFCYVELQSFVVPGSAECGFEPPDSSWFCSCFC